MPLRVPTLALSALLAVALLSTACEEDQAPTPTPEGLSVLSGNNQYSKKATTLPELLRVRVTQDDGSIASGVPLRFGITAGGGSVSHSSRITDSDGLASVSLTLGSNVGTNGVRAAFADDASIFVDFTAEAGNYFCPEEDPTFVRKHSAPHDLYLFTRKSGIHRQGTNTIAGIVRLQPQFLADSFAASSLRSFSEGAILNVPKDVAFSNGGDMFVAWASNEYEIARVPALGDYPHFATLETNAFIGTEITQASRGVLVGCDEFGPFAVGCRDTLGRWEDATYPMGSCNHDAVAVDLDSLSMNYEDIYFIFLADSTLRRLPIDSLSATGPVEMVSALTSDEAMGAKGMVIDKDGSVYILVDTSKTKAIVKVTAGGTRSVVYDFFSRGASPAAGIQNDLAIDRSFSFLYTVDTLNNVLLVYDITQQSLIVLVPDALSDPEAISTVDSFGERVGLVVLP